ncbi:hypothetical protein J4456_03125 [Candidatus Pacearchaeota archaeon]|nr:hypothetical protein [Candidatus Pacearchaeota archaeon]
MNYLEQFLRIVNQDDYNTIESRKNLASLVRIALDNIAQMDRREVYSYCSSCQLFIAGELPSRAIKPKTNSILNPKGIEYYFPICESYVFERNYSSKK